MTYKKVKKFLECLPVIIDYIKKVWEVIEEVITIENELELQRISVNKQEKEK